MSAPVTTNSTKVSAAAGSALTSVKYDHPMRGYDAVNRSLLNDYTFVATVLEVNQQLQCYRLRVAGMPDMVGVALDPTGSTHSFATRTSSLYGVGSRVLAMTTLALGVNQAVILGGISTYLGESDSLGSPELIANSPAGSFKDDISDTGPLNCIFHNFNAGKPIDAYPGDTTVLNSFGCGLFVGALHASLVSGMDCSVECHYLDSLVRVSAFNYEHTTAGSEVLKFADVGDYTEVRRINPYVVESLGGTEQYGELPKADATDRTSYPGKETITGIYKPKELDQIGWWRYSEFEGYLGNIKLNFVTVPKLESVRLSTNADEQDETGVFREHVDTSGAYTVVSAKSIAFIKDCLIPVPREQYRPDDSRGDDAETAEEARSENEVNAIDAVITGIEEELPHAALLYTAASVDLASFKNHRATLNFKERANDWTFKEIDEIDLANFKSTLESSGFVSASNGVSSQRMFAKLPQIGKLKINAREEAQYFASRAMIMMHEDGSIHLQDGYGSTISMRAGGIDISCPGDITLRAGRNVVSMAGDTVSNIAGTDVELSANVGDIRVHADRNVSVLAGNDGAGGILLETKATATNLLQEDQETFKDPSNNSNAYRGIWFKAPKSSVCSLASEVYLGNQTNDCRVYVDSGGADFVAKGARNISLAEQVVFMTNVKKPNAGTNFILTDSAIGMQTNGGVLLQGTSLLASGAKNRDIAFLVKGSALFSQGVQALGYAGKSTTIGSLEEDSFKRVLQSLQEAISSQVENVNAQSEAQQELQEKVDLSVVGKTSSSLKNLTFCYPDSELRGIPTDTEFVMFESDWQQTYRAQGVGKPMIFKGVDPAKPSGPITPGIDKDRSYFWPGAAALFEKFGKMNPDSRFVDDKLRFKKDGFDKPITLSSVAQSFEGNYTIIAENKIRTKE